MWGAIKYLGKLTGDFGADVISRRGCLLLPSYIFQSVGSGENERCSSRDGRGQQNECCVVGMLIWNTAG